MEKYLVLEDGTIFKGTAFGSGADSTGEVVFTTSMTGYVETLTDPSYRGQIVVFASPTTGNYAWNEEMMESDRVQVSGVITKDGHAIYRSTYSDEPLDGFLKKYAIPGIDGIDTRRLIMKIRESGTMKGAICSDPSDLQGIPDPMSTDLLGELRIRKRTIPGSGEFAILLVDTGAKRSIISRLSAIGTVDIVPYNADFASLGEDYDLIFLSNGPGDPAHPANRPLTDFVASRMGKVPIAGICLGHQIIALASGAHTIKMKYGHRGVNHSVTDGRKILITTQNHGYSVDEASIEGTRLKVTLRDSNDRTVEGLESKRKSIMSVQYHPEASPGPMDSMNFFRDVENLARGGRAERHRN